MDVFEHFACYTKLPVRLKDVAAQVKESGGFDDFTYRQVDIDPHVLRGISRVSSVFVNGTRRKVAEILVSSQVNDWPLERMIYCKEMLHTLEDNQYSATTREAVGKLIDGVVVPVPLHQATNSVQSDMLGMLPALLILLPREALAILREKHEDDQLGVETVAQLAQIPTEYARVALSPWWFEIADRIQ